MTEEELKALEKEVRKLKRISSEWASQLHDLVEDRLPAGYEGEDAALGLERLVAQELRLGQAQAPVAVLRHPDGKAAAGRGSAR